MLIPLAVLAAGAVAAGFVFERYFAGHAYGEFWKESLFTGEHNHVLHAMHEIPGWVSFMPFSMMALGFLVSLYVYVLKPGTAQKIAAAFPKLYQFLLNKWYFDRALRLPVCQAGLRHWPAALERRRRPDHRWFWA